MAFGGWIDGATVVLLDDPLNNTKCALIFKRGEPEVIIMMAPLDNPNSARRVPLDELREYFAGPGRALEPETSDRIVKFIRSLERGDS